jgi:hypothetical protein
MNDHECDHEWMMDRLPQYAAGSLPDDERRMVERHLAGCPDCRADLALWKVVAAQVSATNREIKHPAGLIDGALAKVHSQPKPCPVFLRAWQLLRAQAPLVQRELWPASAAVIAIGLVLGIIMRNTGVIRVLAPLVAAASLAVLYGPEHDPAMELTLATPTSPWKVLLARLTLVFGYNLVLALAASLVLLAILPADLLGELILGWLGPMTFLSAIALVLSLWVGTGNAVTVAYMIWLVQFLPSRILQIPAISNTFGTVLTRYQGFWQTPLLLLLLSALLVAAALWSANHREHHLSGTR